MGRAKRIWYLSPIRPATVQASLRIRAVLPEPPLLAHTSSESRGTFRQKARSLAPLNGWACAVKICHDRMLEDTNSLDAPQIAEATNLIMSSTVWHYETHDAKQLSHVTRKPVFGISDQVRLKLACSAIETSLGLVILHIETTDIILSKRWITKALVRLRGCAGWSAPLLFAYGKKRFSHGVTQLYEGTLTKDPQTLDRHDIRMTCQKFDTSTDRHDKK